MANRVDADRVILHVEKAKSEQEAEAVRRALWTAQGVYGVQFDERDRIAVVYVADGESRRAELVDVLERAGFGVIDAVLHQVRGITWQP